MKKSPITAPDLAAERPEPFHDAPPPDPDLARLPLSFRAELAPGSETAIYRYPQYDGWRGEALRVDPKIADSFEMTMPVVGTVPTIVGGPFCLVPCGLYAEWKRIDLLAVPIGTIVELRVKNVGKSVATFHAVIFGRVEMAHYELGRVRTLAAQAAECRHRNMDRWCTWCGAFQAKAGTWELPTLAQARA
jgi:hypothetical protein